MSPRSFSTSIFTVPEFSSFRFGLTDPHKHGLICNVNSSGRLGSPRHLQTPPSPCSDFCNDEGLRRLHMSSDQETLAIFVMDDDGAL